MRFADIVPTNISAAEISACKDLNFAALNTAFKANVWNGFSLFLNNFCGYKKRKNIKQTCCPALKRINALEYSSYFGLLFRKFWKYQCKTG